MAGLAQVSKFAIATKVADDCKPGEDPGRVDRDYSETIRHGEIMDPLCSSLRKQSEMVGGVILRMAVIIPLFMRKWRPSLWGGSGDTASKFRRIASLVEKGQEGLPLWQTYVAIVVIFICLLEIEETN